MILKVYAEKQLMKKALFVFDNMGKLRYSPSLKSRNYLLSNLVRNGESHVASYVHDKMVRAGIVPDVFTITIMVNAYCKDGRVCRAMEFVNYMDCRGFELNVVAYNLLIGGYGYLRDMEGVSRVLKLMFERRITNDVVTYTLLIKSLLDGNCRIGSMDDALRVQDELLRVRLKLNQVICNSLINGFCKLGQVHEADQVIRDMGVQSLKLDSYSYSTLVDAFCKEDRLSEAFKLFDEMLWKKINPSVVTYNTLIKAYAVQMEDFEGALKLWKYILTRGFVKSKVTFNVMINGFCKFGKMVKAEEILCKMKELGCFPDGVAYRSLSDEHSRLGDVEKALDVKGKMEMEGISASVEMYNSLIGRVFKCKRSSKVNDLLIEMHASGLKPNVVTYGALIDG
ncbi:hypothetical protein GIB67_008135 [Kingdonia uniflora]|uniref:Pentatricopeptide repeat-containing protein n=1 Tax=Kingdonia uniflora TaxID=39325 RepID=A0A7J7MSY7_9MAGN|nr:hypothetical protein GIB67_008135 [Kingdonia uniflora]